MPTLAEENQPNAGRTWIPSSARFGLVVLLLLAIASRFIGLGWHDPWGDEVYSYQSSIDLISKLLVWDTPGNNSVSPLPYIEIKVARQLLGDSDWALRTPSAVYGVASVVGLYLLVGWRVSWPVAFFSAFLLALHPLALEWSREARMYTQWLVFAMVTVAMALLCVDRSRHERGSAVDWSWWLLGLLWMPMQASHVLAVTTIGAVGIWLAVMVLIHWACDRRASLIIMGGSMVSVGVFLSSWALAGIGKLMVEARAPKYEEGEVDKVAQLFDAVREVASQIGGYLTMTWATPLWVVAALGLIRLLKRGHWRFTLLITLVATTPWLLYPNIASRHFFTARYVFVALIAFCVGLGAALDWAWDPRSWRVKSVPRIASVVLLAGLAAVWLPVWRSVYLEPKMQVRRALAPILEHANEGDVLVMVPDWYTDLRQYYDFEDAASMIRPPREARYKGLEADRIPNGSIDPYVADFEDLYYPNDQLTDQPPQAAWLFLQNPSLRLDEVSRLFSAYGLDTPEHQATIAQACEGAYTLTMRLSQGRIDHVVITPGRRYR